MLHDLLDCLQECQRIMFRPSKYQHILLQTLTNILCINIDLYIIGVGEAQKSVCLEEMEESLLQWVLNL